MKEFWDVAYRDNAPKLLGVLRRYVRDASIAQDLLHEVFITAIDKYDGYNGKGSFEGWLYRIAVNTALMYLRNERNRQIPVEAVLSMEDDDDFDDIQTDDARNIIETAGFSGEELASAIDRLPEHHRLVFNMYVMEDFSHKQIAMELNISAGTSKSHLARARKKIQQILYDDAMNRNKNKDKNRRRIASALLPLLPLFSAKAHYIDKLYRDGLSDFKIMPTGDAGFMSAALEQSAATVTVQSAVTTTALLGGKMAYMAAFCGAAAITGTSLWIAASDNNPLNSEQNIEHEDVIVNNIDSLTYLPNEQEIDNTILDELTFESSKPSDNTVIIEQTSLSESIFKSESEFNSEMITENVAEQEKASQDNTSESDTTDEKSVEPVVVKKQIIQYQTVVIRDTIIILE